MYQTINAYLYSSTSTFTWAGALVYRSAAFASGTVGYENEVYDVTGWHDNVTNNSRLTAPTGVSLVRASHNTQDTGVPTLQTQKTGANVTGGVLTNVQDSRSCGTSAFIPMTGGTDYITNTAAGDTVANQRVWSSIESIDPTTRYCLARTSINHTLGSAVNTILMFDTEVNDTGNWHGSSSTVTITIASPGVISWTAHGFNNGEPIRFTTTGALPTGLAVNTVYWIVNKNTNDFQLATAPGGAAINTSGSQSGTHTAYNDSRMTVISGVTLVRVTANVQSTAVAAETYELRILKNNATAIGCPAENTRGAGRSNVVSAVLAVTAGDYFQVQVNDSNGGTVTNGDYVWFQIEEVPDIPRALVKKSANQAYTSGSRAAVMFDAEEYDTAAIHGLSSTVTITIASPGVVTWTGHNFANGSPIRFTTTGALPTGITAGTVYYIVNQAANTFQIAATPGGAAINTSGSQSGTHTAHNDSRFTIPAGYSYARLVGNIRAPSTTAVHIMEIWMNNAFTSAGLPGMDFDNNTTGLLNGMSAWMPVNSAGGDYFELMLTTGGVTLAANDALWFGIELKA